MSGPVSQSAESHTIVLLARALWDTIANETIAHSTHYLEIHLPEHALAVFPKTRLEEWSDAYLAGCAAKNNCLLVLVITTDDDDGSDFLALTLAMDTETTAHPVLQ